MKPSEDVFERLAVLMDRTTLISERAAILFDMTGAKAAYRWLNVGAPAPILRLIEFMEEVPPICWPKPMQERFEKARAIGIRKGPQSTTPAARSSSPDHGARGAPRRQTRGRNVNQTSTKRKAGARG